MPKFRVVVHGYDPASAVTPDGPAVGFWTTRYLEAQSVDDAKRLAVDMVRSESRLAEVVKREWLGQPVVSAHEIEEVSSLKKVAGYTFYDQTEYPAG